MNLMKPCDSFVASHPKAEMISFLSIGWVLIALGLYLMIVLPELLGSLIGSFTMGTGGGMQLRIMYWGWWDN